MYCSPDAHDLRVVSVQRYVDDRALVSTRCTHCPFTALASFAPPPLGLAVDEWVRQLAQKDLHPQTTDNLSVSYRLYG